MSETRFLYTWVVIVHRSIVTLTGIPGNLLILAVYWNKTTLGSAQVFINTLALCDLYSCLIIPLELHYWLNELNYTSALLCKLFFTWEVTGWLFSACITTAIAWDRYLAVSQPIKGRWTHNKAFKVCVGCASIAIFVNTGIPFASHIETNVTIAGTDIVNGTRCEQYDNDLILFLLVFIPQYLCFSILFVITITLYIRLWNKVKKRRNSTGDFALTARSSQVVVKKRMPERTISTKDYTNNCVSFENGMNNPSSNGASIEIGTNRENLNLQDFHNMAHLGPSIPGTVEEVGLFSIPLSSGCVVALNTGHPEDEAIKDPAVFLTLNRNHGVLEGARKPALGGNLPPVSNRLRPISGLTQMLLLSTVIFVCTWSLSILIYIITPVTKNISRRSFGFAVVAALRLTGLINHSINPVVYSFMNPKFRGECRLLFKRLRRRLCQV